MSRKPSSETTTAWARLVRTQQTLTCAIEKELKGAGFPPLGWYDALLELSREPHGALRPLELEKRMLMPQYSTSRLVDRLVESGFAERKSCPVDGRGQFVVITPEGRALQKKMWDVYGAAIERHVGTKLSGKEAASLGKLLGKLA
jgi:DNA-binding MarR family transcriptional regulator